MANTLNIPRTHLTMGLCLPVAVILGYFLAQPLDSSSMAVVMLVLSLLSVPLFMKWHHPLLVLSWNTAAYPLFIPGRPALWMVMSVIGLFFALLARSVQTERRFIQVPTITKPLLFLMAVVLLTAKLTGGMGIRSMGSERYGGRGYFNILAAVMGYFALISTRIPPHRAAVYVSMFFLAGLTSLVGDLAVAAGPHFYVLTAIFAPDGGIEQIASGGNLSAGAFRIGALTTAGAALYSWLLARHGMRGVMELTRPWRMFSVGVAIAGCMVSGYRSSIILFALTMGCLFYFEGLHRTRFLPMLAALVIICAALVLPQAERLPLMAQRALSFLPAVPIDPVAKESAQASTQWRVEMWKQVLPMIPKYLFIGKGYALDPNDLFMAQQSAFRGFGIQATAALVAGDYHNGPLSVVIPFGLFGIIGFAWLLLAGVRVLYHHYRFGDPSIQRINTFILAAFVAKALFFTFVFGSISGDLCVLLGLLGLSTSINGPPRGCPQPATNPGSLTIVGQRAY